MYRGYSFSVQIDYLHREGCAKSPIGTVCSLRGANLFSLVAIYRSKLKKCTEKDVTEVLMCRKRALKVQIYVARRRHTPDVQI